MRFSPVHLCPRLSYALDLSHATRPLLLPKLPPPLDNHHVVALVVPDLVDQNMLKIACAGE